MENTNYDKLLEEAGDLAKIKCDRYYNWRALITHIKPFVSEFEEDDWVNHKRDLLADKKRISLLKGLCCTEYKDPEKEVERKFLIDFVATEQDKELFLAYLDRTLSWFVDNSHSFRKRRKLPNIVQRRVDLYGPYWTVVQDVIKLYEMLWPRPKS